MCRIQTLILPRKCGLVTKSVERNNWKRNSSSSRDSKEERNNYVDFLLHICIIIIVTKQHKFMCFTTCFQYYFPSLTMDALSRRNNAALLAIESFFSRVLGLPKAGNNPKSDSEGKNSWLAWQAAWFCLLFLYSRFSQHEQSQPSSSVLFIHKPCIRYTIYTKCSLCRRCKSATFIR